MPPKNVELGGSVAVRVRPRLFDQVGHETMFASSENKHFFTKSCHRQTYQNYEQPPQTSQNWYFQSHFSIFKIGESFRDKFFYEEYLTRRPTLFSKIVPNYCRLCS